ncbi:MAG: transglycosylase domain-containing protein [Flavobacteriales bacterium]
MKLLFKILLYSMLTGVLSLWLFIAYAVSDYNSSYNPEVINSLVKKAKTSKQLPQAFIDVYYKINTKRNSKEVLYHALIDQRTRPCPSMEMAGFISHVAINNNKFLANRYVFAMKLENYLSQEECLNYLTERHDFLYSNIGIRQASTYYFKKDLEHLNTKEYATLVLMLKNPSIYNPKKNPNRLESRLRAYNLE